MNEASCVSYLIRTSSSAGLFEVQDFSNKVCGYVIPVSGSVISSIGYSELPYFIQTKITIWKKFRLVTLLSHHQARRIFRTRQLVAILKFANYFAYVALSVLPKLRCPPAPRKVLWFFFFWATTTENGSCGCSCVVVNWEHQLIRFVVKYTRGHDTRSLTQSGCSDWLSINSH